MTVIEHLSGNLKNETLPELFLKLHASRATGMLTLQREKQVKWIYVKEGQIIFAGSNQEADHLGNRLIRAGKLTPPQVEAVLKLQSAAHKKFGAIVVELGFMDPKELFEELKRHVKEIIMSVFLWEIAAYRFRPGPLPPDVIALVIDPVRLISEIIHRILGQTPSTKSRSPVQPDSNDPP